MLTLKKNLLQKVTSLNCKKLTVGHSLLILQRGNSPL